MKTDYKLAFKDLFEMLKEEKRKSNQYIIQLTYEKEKNKKLQAELNREKNRLKSQWQFYKKNLLRLENELTDLEINMTKKIKRLPDFGIDDILYKKIKKSDEIIFVTKT